jgi:hypothetical protein
MRCKRPSRACTGSDTECGASYRWRSRLSRVFDLLPDCLSRSTDTFLEETDALIIAAGLAGELVQAATESGRTDQSGRSTRDVTTSTDRGAAQCSEGDALPALPTRCLSLLDRAGAQVTARSDQSAAQTALACRTAAAIDISCRTCSGFRPRSFALSRTTWASHWSALPNITG